MDIDYEPMDIDDDEPMDIPSYNFLQELYDGINKLNKQPPNIKRPPEPLDRDKIPFNKVSPFNEQFIFQGNLHQQNTSVNIQTLLNKYPIPQKNEVINYEQYFISKYLKFLGNKYRNINFQNINNSVLDKLLSDKHYCGNVNKAFMTLINSIFKIYRKNASSGNYGELQLPNTIQKLIDDIILLSDDSAESVVYSSSFNHLDDKLILKVSKDSNSQELIHEFFIGMILNELRFEIPNFMYVYSLFKCGHINNPTNFKLCEKIGDVNTMLIEKIDGKTLFDELYIMNEYDLINTIFQIFLALQMAYDSCGFIHQDLHLKNILIKKLPDKKVIKYSLKDYGDIYVKTDFYAVIIDYGFSAVYDDNVKKYITIKDFNNLQSANWANIQPKPGIDLYKVLAGLFLLMEADSTTSGPAVKFNTIRTIIKKIYSDFGVSTNYIANYGFPVEYDQVILDITPGIFLEAFKAKLETNYYSYDLSFITNSPPKGFVEIDKDCKDNVDTILKDLTTLEKSPQPCRNKPWKKLDKDWKDDMGDSRYWFDCGTFFFDGSFNVVKFPEGMSLYHGSSNLAYTNSKFPLGFEYYNTNNDLLSSDDIEYLKNPAYDDEEKMQYIEDKSPISLSYFGDYKIAKDFSTKPLGNNMLCGYNCISAYKLKKDAVFIDINDPYNILVLLHGPYGLLNDNNREILRTNYNLEGIKDNDFEDLKKTYGRGFVNIPRNERWKLQQAFHPLRRFISKTMKRDALMENNYSLPRELLSKIKDEGYAGITSSRNPSNYDPNNYRFAEITFGSNVKKFLERDYQNKLDWQYFDNKRLFGEIGKLIKDFEKYKTLNVDYHQGDLLEHSIWTALYVQKQWENKTPWVENLNESSFRTFSIITAFLHDIGKGGDLNYVYYDKPGYEVRGFEYLTNLREYKLSEEKSLNISEVFKNINLNTETYLKVCAFIILSHREFEEHIKRINNGESMNNISSQYIKVLEKNIMNAGLGNITKDDKIHTFLLTILISACDIMASEAFVNDTKFRKLTPKIRKDPKTIVNNLNDVLIDFPYIHNRSKSHKGSNNYDKFNVEQVGLQLRKQVYGKILLDQT